MTGRWRTVALLMFGACAFATPLGGRAVERACAAGNVHIAVVVDIGSGNSVSAVCVPGSATANGASILSARASMLGVQQPRYSSSGLLCAIDGIPATGCGEQHDGKYAYWSYWHGIGGNWSYASIGPGGSRVSTAIVEGWRWQPNGTGLPTDPPPRGPANVSAVCVVSVPATTAAPTTTPRTAPPITTGKTSPTTIGALGNPTSTTDPTTKPGPHPSTPTSSGAAVATTRPKPGATTATTGRDRASTGTTDRSGSAAGIVLTHGGIAGPPVHHSSGGAPVGLIVGVGLVVALGAGGTIAARRRSRAAH